MRKATIPVSISPAELTSRFRQQSILTLLLLQEVQIYVMLNKPEHVFLLEDVTRNEG